MEWDANIPGPSRAAIAYATCTVPASASSEGAGRWHPPRSASVESTGTVAAQVTPSLECDMTMSAVLSLRTDHQTAYHSPDASRATRTLLEHCPRTAGSGMFAAGRATRRCCASKTRSDDSARLDGSGAGSLHSMGSGLHAPQSEAKRSVATVRSQRGL